MLKIIDRQPKIIKIEEITMEVLKKIPPYIMIRPMKISNKANERMVFILLPLNNFIFLFPPFFYHIIVEE